MYPIVEIVQSGAIAFVPTTPLLLRLALRSPDPLVTKIQLAPARQGFPAPAKSNSKHTH
jgi:hypothetical protein